MAGEHAAVKFPRQVAAGTARAGEAYTLQDGYYAVHGRVPGAPAPGAVLVLEDGAIAVFAGSLAAAGEGGETSARINIGPVYAQPGGPLAVPTGLVFVRFREGTAAGARRADIERAGYELVQVPAYAPHAAWVCAQPGGIAAALQNSAALAALSGVENVEPQMLMERATR